MFEIDNLPELIKRQIMSYLTLGDFKTAKIIYDEWLTAKSQSVREVST